MSANEVKVNGTDGHAMGAEHAESAPASVPETNPPKKRGRPRKSRNETPPPAPEGVAIVDPRQLLLAGGEGTWPESISVASLRVMMVELEGRMLDRACKLELEGEGYRREREHASRDVGLAAFCYHAEGQVMRGAYELRVAVAMLARALGGLGVR